MSAVRFATREALQVTLEEWCLKLVNPISKYRSGALRVLSGSTAVYLEVMEFGRELFGVNVSGVVLHKVPRSDELALELLTSDQFNDYYAGAWVVSGYDDDSSTFRLDYNLCLFANQLDQVEFESAVRLVAHVSDNHDEELQAKYGGKLWSES